MRPALGTTILLLGVLVFVMTSAAENARDKILQTCRTKFPLQPCGSDGWYQLDENRCMKLFETWKNFYQAERFCREEFPGGMLVLIKNLMAYNKVLCLLVSSSVRTLPCWIGAKRDENNRKKFYWLDGTEVKFSRWNPGEPNSQHGFEECVEMNSRNKLKTEVLGHWSDVIASKSSYYICQKTV